MAAGDILSAVRTAMILLFLIGVVGVEWASGDSDPNRRRAYETAWRRSNDRWIGYENKPTQGPGFAGSYRHPGPSYNTGSSRGAVDNQPTVTREFVPRTYRRGTAGQRLTGRNSSQTAGGSRQGASVSRGTASGQRIYDNSPGGRTSGTRVSQQWSFSRGSGVVSRTRSETSDTNGRSRTDDRTERLGGSGSAYDARQRALEERRRRYDARRRAFEAGRQPAASTSYASRGTVVSSRRITATSVNGRQATRPPSSNSYRAGRQQGSTSYTSGRTAVSGRRSSSTSVNGRQATRPPSDSYEARMREYEEKRRLYEERRRAFEARHRSARTTASPARYTRLAQPVTPDPRQTSYAARRQLYEERRRQYEARRRLAAATTTTTTTRAPVTRGYNYYDAVRWYRSSPAPTVDPRRRTYVRPTPATSGYGYRGNDADSRSRTYITSRTVTVGSSNGRSSGYGSRKTGGSDRSTSVAVSGSLQNGSVSGRRNYINNAGDKVYDSRRSSYYEVVSRPTTSARITAGSSGRRSYETSGRWSSRRSNRGDTSRSGPKVNATSSRRSNVVNNPDGRDGGSTSSRSSVYTSGRRTNVGSTSDRSSVSTSSRSNVYTSGRRTNVGSSRRSNAGSDRRGDKAKGGRRRQPRPARVTPRPATRRQPYDSRRRSGSDTRRRGETSRSGDPRYGSTGQPQNRHNVFRSGFVLRHRVRRPLLVKHFLTLSRNNYIIIRFVPRHEFVFLNLRVHARNDNNNVQASKQLKYRLT
ncbi:hypothetical protein LSAT2_017112, partial [Lamellibrachia satsuma]